MEWKTVKLGDVCILIPGFAFKSKDFGNYPHKVLKIKDIYSSINSCEGMDGIQLSKYNKVKLEKYLLNPGDFVCAMTGSLGKIGKYIAKQPVYINQRVLKFLPLDVIDKNFLYYTLCTYDFFMYVINHADSESVQPNISSTTIGKYEIQVPPLAEQKRIAAILSSLDAKIENNNRINANLEAQAQALYKSWFVDFEPWGGVMPEDWKEGMLGDYVTVKRGGSPRPIQAYLSTEGYRWLKISDATAEQSPFICKIVEHIKKEGLNKTVFLEKGNLVLSNSATPGLPKFLELDTCIHDGWLYFPKSYFPKEFLYLLFQREREYLISQGNGSVFTNLKTEIVKNLSVIVPPTDILTKFQNIAYAIFEQIKKNCQESQRLAQLRDTLLPKLMKGEIEL